MAFVGPANKMAGRNKSAENKIRFIKSAVMVADTTPSAATAQCTLAFAPEFKLGATGPQTLVNYFTNFLPRRVDGANVATLLKNIF
jgi:hypothetical protein